MRLRVRMWQGWQAATHGAPCRRGSPYLTTTTLPPLPCHYHLATTTLPPLPRHDYLAVEGRLHQEQEALSDLAAIAAGAQQQLQAAAVHAARLARALLPAGVCRRGGGVAEVLASSTPCGGNEVPLYPNPTPTPTPPPAPGLKRRRAVRSSPASTHALSAASSSCAPSEGPWGPSGPWGPWVPWGPWAAWGRRRAARSSPSTGLAAALHSR